MVRSTHAASSLEYWVTRSSRAMTVVCVAATSLLLPGSRHRRPQIALRVWEVQGPRSPSRRGRWKRRKAQLGNGRGLSSGSPEDRCTRQRLSALHRGVLRPRSVLPGTWQPSAISRRMPVPVQPGYWQSPIVGPDGNPRPPECGELRWLPARRRRSHPHVPKRPIETLPPVG